MLVEDPDCKHVYSFLLEKPVFVETGPVYLITRLTPIWNRGRSSTGTHHVLDELVGVTGVT